MRFIASIALLAAAEGRLLKATQQPEQAGVRLSAKDVHPDTKIFLNGVQQVGKGTKIQDQAINDYCRNFADQHNQDLSHDHRVANNFQGEGVPQTLVAAEDPTQAYGGRNLRVCGGGNYVNIMLRADCKDYPNAMVKLGHCDTSIGPDDKEFCQEWSVDSIKEKLDQPLVDEWQSWVVKDCSDE